MIDFKPITLQDKKNIDNCLRHNQSKACDYCFTNLFAWSSKFQSTFCIIQETLFLQFNVDGEVFYLMPVGKMAIKKAFDLIKQDAQERKIALQFKAISEDMWKEIQRQMPNEFVYTNERENSEYIYLTEKLITLKGKKLQSKRNHINRFKAENPNWTFSIIEKREDCYDCLNMLKEWEAENSGKNDFSLRYDYIASKLMLKNFDELQLQGGMIHVNGKIVAFSVGEPLTPDTFVIHIEKAHKDINGTYAIINQQMAEHVAAPYTYINREEDMGFESLRKAKLSYYPDILLQEGVLKSLATAKKKPENETTSMDTFCYYI